MNKLFKNFSNSSSWHASEEDLDDFDTDINLKPVHTGTSSSLSNHKRHLNSMFYNRLKSVDFELLKK